jgi:hypothetical protein
VSSAAPPLAVELTLDQPRSDEDLGLDGPDGQDSSQSDWNLSPGGQPAFDEVSSQYDPVAGEPSGDSEPAIGDSEPATKLVRGALDQQSHEAGDESRGQAGSWP